MKRRTLLSSLTILPATSLLGLTGCGDKRSARLQSLPAIASFSRERLHARLEELRLAYETKGFHVTDSLLPGLSEQEVRAQCSWFPAPLPEELIALYGWHNGQRQPVGENESPFWFRDCIFSTLADAKAEYASMMSGYGVNPADGPLVRIAFPFAAYEGGWLVMPCAEQTVEPRLPRPIINVMEGIAVHYYSIELMVETAIEWVSHPAYDGHGLPQDEEMRIWRKHNPGIFTN